MGVIELSTLLILLLYISVRGKNREKILCVISMIILFFISALRDETVGGDIVRYLSNYEKYARYNFKTLTSVLLKDDIKDPGYHFTTWIFSRVFKDPQMWLTLVGFLFCFSAGRLIYKESKKTVISVLMLISVGFFSFSLTGLRQTIAISILMFSYKFLKERKLLPFIIIVLIASVYHKTALIFLIIYPISNMELGKYHIIAAAVAFITFYAFKGWMLSFLSQYLQEDRYQGYLSGEASRLTMSGLIIQAAIFCFCLYYYKPHIKQDRNALILYNMSFFGLIFQLFSSFIAEFFRISMYFSIFNCILVPNSMMCETETKSRKVVQLVLTLILLLYMIQDGKEYYMFFWQ